MTKGGCSAKNITNLQSIIIAFTNPWLYTTRQASGQVIWVGDFSYPIRTYGSYARPSDVVSEGGMA